MLDMINSITSALFLYVATTSGNSGWFFWKKSAASRRHFAYAMRKELQDNDASNYSAEARAWATSNGLIAGNGTTVNGEPNCMWGDVLTREQFVTVLYRWAQMIGKA